MRRMFSLEQLKTLVKEQVESGLLDNAKPIYHHPIYLYFRKEGANIIIGCLSILDNNPNAYTTATLPQKLKDLMETGAYINFNGAYRSDGESNYNIGIMFLKTNENQYSVLGCTSTNESTQIIDWTQLTSVSDGVNKIN